MKLTKSQLLNITTGVLHTNMDDIYLFFNTVEEGIMTHMLPNACKAIQPILKVKYPDLPTEGFHPDIEDKDKEYDVEFTEEEKNLFWKNYGELPSLLANKTVIPVIIQQ